MSQRPTHLSDLPADLPIPTDDGASDHLIGMPLPDVELAATTGERVSLARVAEQIVVVYCYPRTGLPDVPIAPGWDAIPGARGCTPHNIAFRDHYGELRALGAAVFGLSTQTTQYQQEMAQRLSLPYPVLSDAQFRLTDALRLPTFVFDGVRLLMRLSFVAIGGTIEHVEYPVFPPGADADGIVSWLRERSKMKRDV
ncbi:MAG TPA: peroxiredoxin [Candidatus Binatus sp.]|nr:peroxiredoxin [Candidatus Binatus sp.]